MQSFSLYVTRLNLAFYHCRPFNLVYAVIGCYCVTMYYVKQVIFSLLLGGGEVLLYHVLCIFVICMDCCVL